MWFPPLREIYVMMRLCLRWCALSGCRCVGCFKPKKRGGGGCTWKNCLNGVWWPEINYSKMHNPTRKKNYLSAHRIVPPSRPVWSKFLWYCQILIEWHNWIQLLGTVYLHLHPYSRSRLGTTTPRRGEPGALSALSLAFGSYHSRVHALCRARLGLLMVPTIRCATSAFPCKIDSKIGPFPGKPGYWVVPKRRRRVILSAWCCFRIKPYFWIRPFLLSDHGG